MVEILDTSVGVDESLIEGVIETLVFEVGYIEKNVILVWVDNNLVIEVGLFSYFLTKVGFIVNQVIVVGVVKSLL